MVQSAMVDQSAMDSPFSFSTAQAGTRSSMADTSRSNSSRAEKPHRHFRAPQTLASHSHQQRAMSRPVESDASSRFQDAREDLDSRTSSLGDSGSEYQDCASPGAIA